MIRDTLCCHMLPRFVSLISEIWSLLRGIRERSQCIEDSASLALCLERAETLADIPKVLSAYETIRKPRTEWCIKKGRQNARMLHMPD